jgi:hypothetical protein
MREKSITGVSVAITIFCGLSPIFREKIGAFLKKTML